MLLNEVYKKRVNKMISEEYGISNTLHYDIIPRFQNQLKNEIKQSEPATNYGIDCKRGRFVFDCGDKKNTEFKVYWTVYYFKDKYEYDKFTQQHLLNNGLAFEYKMINITIVYINGKPLNGQFYDSIGHEFEHVYQNVLMGKDFGNKKIYSLVISNINSTNKYDVCLSWIIYASTKSEQEAMINGFFNEFSNGNIDINDLDTEIKESECGAWLRRLYKAYSFLKQNNDANMQESIRKYKNIKDYYNYKYFLYIARNGIKNLERKIARLTLKIKQTIYNNSKPQLNENFDVLKNYYLIQ